MRDLINLIENANISNKNLGIYKGRKFWSGAFDTRDGHIIEVHSYERAEGADFHHSFYFSQKALSMMNDDEAAFFWIDDKGLQTQWRSSASSPIRNEIQKQIEILKESVDNVVYHGGTNREPTHFPFFVTPDRAMAQSYADDRQGELYAYDFHPTKIANISTVEAVADRLGIDHYTLPSYELISPNVNHDAESILVELVKEGYDTVSFNDHSMNDEFAEYPAYAVLKAGVITPR